MEQGHTWIKVTHGVRYRGARTHACSVYNRVNAFSPAANRPLSLEAYRHHPRMPKPARCYSGACWRKHA
jgi:hypothetical protein